MKPSKKKPRIRNRPRNKANRLKNEFELQNENNESEEEQSENNGSEVTVNKSMKANELSNANISNATIVNEISANNQNGIQNHNQGVTQLQEDRYSPSDDDMPQLMEEDKPTEKNLTPKTAAPNQSVSSNNAVNNQDPMENLERLIKKETEKKLQKQIKQQQNQSSPQQNVKSSPKTDLKKTPKANDKKSKEKNNGANMEQNAFIQNLQRQMESMVANGKYSCIVVIIFVAVPHRGTPNMLELVKFKILLISRKIKEKISLQFVIIPLDFYTLACA